MQHNQTTNRAFAAVATEALLANTATLDTSDEMLVTIKTGTVELGERHTATKTENCTDLISILLVDDHALMREGLRQALIPEEV
jgi:hypothetical protein